MKADVALLFAALLLAGGFAVPARADDTPTAGTLAGNYYSGDHLGYNVILRLDVAGGYTADWTGCLGHYGDAKGHWVVKGEDLVLTPNHETGMMKKHLRNLRIVAETGGFVFVQPEWLKYYLESGTRESNTLFAFVKQAASK